MLVAEYNTSGTMLRRYVPGQGVDETLSLARARGVHRSKPSAGRFCRPAANRSSRYEGADLSSPHWLHTDQQGSVIAATDASATATPYAYSVTGEPKGGWSSSAPAFRYTGQVAIPSAALYFYKARMYDPALSRFLQTDPTGYSAGMNLYAYVGNDPVNRVDPSGQFQVCIPGWDITVAEEGHEAAVHMPTVCQDYPDSILAPLPPPSIPPSKDSPPGNGTNNQPQQRGRDPGAAACSIYVAKRDGLSLGADIAGGALLLAAPEVWAAGLAVSSVTLLASGYNFRTADVGGSIAGVVNAGAGYHLSAFSAVKSFSQNARFLGLGSDLLAGYLDARTAMDDYAACRAGNAGP